MSSIKPMALRLREENFTNFTIKVILFGVTDYNPPLPHSYISMASKEYD